MNKSPWRLKEVDSSPWRLEEVDGGDPDDTTGDPKKKRRGESFNMREDKLLCDAWLATSIDPIHGTEQKGTTFWRNIHIWFHKHKHFTLTLSSATVNKSPSTINGTPSKRPCPSIAHT